MDIKDKIKGIVEVALEDLHDLQPENIKRPYNYGATKKRIERHGFVNPFAVWKDKEKYYIVDGHLRKDLLMELKADGLNVPEKLKAFELDLKDEKEAKAVLVECFNIKSNPFDGSVLNEWGQEEEWDLDGVNVEWHEYESIDDSITELEDEKFAIKLEYNEEDYKFVQYKIQQIGQTAERILYDALEKYN